MKKYTKIIATLGPSLNDAQILEKTILEGVDVCRLNLSHGSLSFHAQTIEKIRIIREKLKRNIAILIDLQGPKLRIGDIASTDSEGKKGIFLEENQEIIFTTLPCLGTKEKVFIDYSSFCNDVKIGEHILVDDGKLLFEVTKIQKSNENAEGGEVYTKVLHGGFLQGRKGVNLPNTKISLNCLTTKDLSDLDFAIAQKVEWIGLSFVRNSSDILEIKKIIADKNGSAKVIAKIEKPEALEDIDAIIQVADAIMVARGDLGVEIPLEKVPLVQKEIVKKCRQYAKPVIIATQMMESMIEQISPTRAEVNDVANAVLDGADALMLSGETSVGKHPDQVIRTMTKIIQEVEKNGTFFYSSSLFEQEKKPEIAKDRRVSNAICDSAVHLTKQMNCKCIVTMTASGYAPLLLAAYRPKTKIVAFTNNRELMYQLSLVWGVEGIYYDKLLSTDETIQDTLNILKNNQYLQTDDFVIHLNTIPREKMGKTNMLKLTKVD